LACDFTGIALFRGLSVSDIFRDTSWLSSPQAENWTARTSITASTIKPLAKPMLVIEGIKDEVALPELVDPILRRHCEEYGNKDGVAEVRILSYPGMDHLSIPNAAQPQIFGWVEKRFAETRRKGMKRNGCLWEVMEAV